MINRSTIIYNKIITQLKFNKRNWNCLKFHSNLDHELSLLFCYYFFLRRNSHPFNYSWQGNRPSHLTQYWYARGNFGSITLALVLLLAQTLLSLVDNLFELFSKVGRLESHCKLFHAVRLLGVIHASPHPRFVRSLQRQELKVWRQQQVQDNLVHLFASQK